MLLSSTVNISLYLPPSHLIFVLSYRRPTLVWRKSTNEQRWMKQTKRNKHHFYRLILHHTASSTAAWNVHEKWNGRVPFPPRPLPPRPLPPISAHPLPNSYRLMFGFLRFWLSCHVSLRLPWTFVLNKNGRDLRPIVINFWMASTSFLKPLSLVWFLKCFVLDCCRT